MSTLGPQWLGLTLRHAALSFAPAVALAGLARGA